jgi:predicted glycogen debranching enzyme
MLYLGIDTLHNLEKASRYEWLETNGLGGFASSTVVGLNTRRYHALLCAALEPPTERCVLLSKLEETLLVDGRRYDLSVNAYPGVVHPCGYEIQSSFRMEPFPSFAWQVDDIEFSKSVFLVHESNTAVIQYFLRAQGTAAKRDVKLEVRPLVAFRGYHELTRRNDAFRTAYSAAEGCVTIAPYESLPTLHIAHDAAAVEGSGEWYFNFEYQEEKRRGLDFSEDLFQPFVLHFDLNASSQAAVIASLEPRDIGSVPQLRNAETARRKALGGKLAAAADHFIVKRGDRHSIIAGYPWFVDWGRDAMVSLPGLTLSTARSATARDILNEFSAWIRNGMLPNNFPDRGVQPEYNTIDAGLWYIEAVRAYIERTNDFDWLYPAIYRGLEEIIDAYVRGTRYNIRCDSDGLVHGGEPGIALTWMDARINGVPVTPRIGKPVEIQALWYNALRTVEGFAARQEGKRGRYYAGLADATHTGFETKFWNGAAGCLFDVIEGPDGQNDASIRPNQIFALSLHHKLVDGERALQILEVVERELLTPFGLRTLSPRDPGYRGRFEGDMASRDSAYHLGTVWPWLMGPFALAWFDAHDRDPASRQRCLEWLSALKEYRTSEGMNQVPEVFDGDPPQRPGGCTAQAWSLAMLIQAFQTVY